MTADLDPAVRVLRDERLRRGWSRETVMLLSGSAFTTMSLLRWENGHTLPNIGHLRAWASALGFDVPQPARARTAVAA